MKAIPIIILGIIIVILAGGIYYLLVLAPEPSMPVTPATETMNTSSNAGVQTALATYILDATTSPASGSYLIAMSGMTLYTYANDASSTSNCVSATCIALWPPYTISSGTTLAASAAVTGTLGTITRSDGSMQLTHNGAPLYFYAHDAAPGDVNGASVSAAWSLARP